MTWPHAAFVSPLEASACGSAASRMEPSRRRVCKIDRELVSGRYGTAAAQAARMLQRRPQGAGGARAYIYIPAKILISAVGPASDLYRTSTTSAASACSPAHGCEIYRRSPRSMGTVITRWGHTQLSQAVYHYMTLCVYVPQWLYNRGTYNRVLGRTCEVEDGDR